MTEKPLREETFSAQNRADIALWLAGRPATTQRAYSLEMKRLESSLSDRPFRSAELADLQRHAAALARLSLRSQARSIAALRSFYRFLARAGAIDRDPALPLISPAIPNDLAERILEAADVERLIASGGSALERLALRLLYMAGFRADELCGLRWRALGPRDEGGQATVTGKGGKTRAVLLPPAIWGDLMALEPENAAPGDPIFPAPRDPARCMGQRQLLKIVKRAARAAGLSAKISSHWLRHAHASHALDAGAPIMLVRDTLGHASIATTNRYAHARPGDGSARFLTR